MSMSLLEDARRLADIESWYGMGGDGYCIACDNPVRSPNGEHASDCPTLALPRIVAALEAAERVVRIHDENSRVVWDSPVFHEIDVLGDTLRGEAYTLEAPPA